MNSNILWSLDFRLSLSAGQMFGGFCCSYLGCKPSSNDTTRLIIKKLQVFTFSLCLSHSDWITQFNISFIHLTASSWRFFLHSGFSPNIQQSIPPKPLTFYPVITMSFKRILNKKKYLTGSNVRPPDADTIMFPDLWPLTHTKTVQQHTTHAHMFY